VVPVKDLGGAKQRLASVLSRAERRDLYRAMLEDVLACLAAVEGLAGMALVTRDEEAATLARPFGARIIDEPANRGHSAAVTTAAKMLAAEGAAGLLQVPGDVPLATAAEIETVLAAHRSIPSVTLVPSHDERGSNCVVASPPDAIPFLFGDDSFGPHRSAARARGIEPAILRLAGLSLDIDTPDDLAALMARPGRCRAQAYLEENGIRERLAVPLAAEVG
jgi:2-phospho-L-lactate guanylyltransferase